MHEQVMSHMMEHMHMSDMQVIGAFHWVLDDTAR
jgi:hypothetical protein